MVDVSNLKNTPETSAPQSTIARRRLRVGFGVALLSVLAVAVLYFVLSLSESSTFRYRHDFSAVGRNSLDPSTEDLLKRLESPVTAHVFFRAENTPVDAAVAEARERYMDLLLVASGVASDRFEFEAYDLTDVAAASDRMRSLGLDRVNAIVLTTGEGESERRALLRVDAESLDITRDPANPQRFVLRDFRGEEALQEGLLKLSSKNRKRVLVATGHGERDIEGTDELGMQRLGAELAGDGFDVGIWDALENGPIGDDVDILFIAAPRDAYSQEELALVRAFVDRGGRLLVIAGEELYRGAGSTGALLETYGILAEPGRLMAPTLDLMTNQMAQGMVQCGDFFVREAGLNSRHPITKPIWEAALRVRAINTRSFERGMAPNGGTLQSLLAQNAKGAWIDLPLFIGQHDPRTGYNWSVDVGREKIGASYSLAMASEFPVEAGEDVPLDDPRRRARVVGIAMPEMASNALFASNQTANRDFLLNCFNWLAERDFNVRVSLRKDERTMLDVYRGTELITLQRFAWWGLPGLLAGIGLLLGWRRKS